MGILQNDDIVRDHLQLPASDAIGKFTLPAPCSGTGPSPEPEESEEPEPIDPTPAPIDPTPAPADPTPAPADPTPAPADPTPAPTEPTPAPTEPTPTPSPTNPSSGPPPAPGQKQCTGVGAYKNQPGIDDYCNQMCNHIPPHCPASHCACTDGPAPAPMPSPPAPVPSPPAPAPEPTPIGELQCRPTEVYKAQPGMDQWCNDHCNDIVNPYCPASHCICD